MRREVLQDVRTGRSCRSRLIRKGRLRSKALPGFWLDVEWLWRQREIDPLDCLARILGRKG